MKNIGSYIGSFILSVILVFSLLLTLIMTIITSFANPDRLYDITKEKNLSNVVCTQLEKYYSQRYNATGIPTDVYMNAISEDYINNVIQTEINNAFYILINEEQTDSVINATLETAISDFYSDYADSIGAEKDAKYDEKLSTAKANSYKVIAEYCDVYKFDSMQKSGILAKISPFFVKIPTVALIVYGSVGVLILLLMLVNLNSIKTTLYWSGVSAVISAVIGAVPCLYLRFTDFFSAFTIKQAQIYAAYTGLLNSALNGFLYAVAVDFAVGVICLLIYGVLVKNKKYIKNQENDLTNPE